MVNSRSKPEPKKINKQPKRRSPNRSDGHRSQSLHPKSLGGRDDRPKDHRKPHKKQSSSDMFRSGSEDYGSSGSLHTPKQIRRKHTEFQYHNEDTVDGQTTVVVPKKKPEKPPKDLHRVTSISSSMPSFASFAVLSTSEEEFDNSKPYYPAEHVERPPKKKHPVEPKLSVPPEMIQPVKDQKKAYNSKDIVNPSVSEPIKGKKASRKRNSKAKASQENMVEYFQDNKDHVHKGMDKRPALGSDPKLKHQTIPDFGAHRAHESKDAELGPVTDLAKVLKEMESQHPSHQPIFGTIEHNQISSTMFDTKKKKKPSKTDPPPPSRLPPGARHSKASIVPAPNKIVNKVDNLEPLHQKIDPTLISQHRKSLAPDGKPKKIVYSNGMKLGQFIAIPKGGQKDFVRDNVLAAIRIPAKIPVPTLVDDQKGHKSAWAQSGLCRTYVFSKGFGKVPKYICDRKRELLREDRQLKWALDEYGIVECCDPIQNGMNQIGLLNLLTKRDPTLQVGTTGLSLIRKCYR